MIIFIAEVIIVRSPSDVCNFDFSNVMTGGPMAARIGRNFNLLYLAKLQCHLNAVNTKFLLADDDADDAHLFCEALTRLDPEMECYTVENGRGVFELLLENKPDVIFLDINMPVMNGWECLKKLKDNSSYKDIPAIMYSTSSAKKDVEKAYTLGAQLFVTKPEDFRELCQILEIVATNSKDSLLKELRRFQSIKTA